MCEDGIVVIGLYSSVKQASCEQVGEIHVGYIHGNGLHLKNATSSSGKTLP